MRQIARNIARETMKRAGFTRINKKRAVYGGRSLFSLHWRDALAAGAEETGSGVRRGVRLCHRRAC